MLSNIGPLLRNPDRPGYRDPRTSTPVLRSRESLNYYASPLLIPRNVPEVQIELANHPDPYVTYTTGSALSGTVSIATTERTPFDEVQIVLEGSSHVVLEQSSHITGHSEIEASHTFLKLNMPIKKADYPYPRILEPWALNSFNFNFVIPAQLLPQACRHKCVADHVHDAHLELPPSMGDPRISQTDDLSPESGCVSYKIVAKVVRHHDSRKTKPLVIATASHPIRVIPSVPEAPPLHFTGSEYMFTKTKKLKTGIFSSRLGTLSLKASQPAPFIVSHEASRAIVDSSTITVPLTIRFDPFKASHVPPPLVNLTANIHSFTFAAIKGQASISTSPTPRSPNDPSRIVHTRSVPLETSSVSDLVDCPVQWRFVSANAHHGAGSHSDDDQIPTPTNASQTEMTTVTSDCEDRSSPTARQAHKLQVRADGYYEAQITLPLSLPSDKSWLPTFHSCLTSRIYALEFSLGVAKPRASSHETATTLQVCVPVQIACGTREYGVSDGEEAYDDGIGAWNEDAADEAADDDLAGYDASSARDSLILNPQDSWRRDDPYQETEPEPNEDPPAYAEFTRRRTAISRGWVA
jgi:hypothetical protein